MSIRLLIMSCDRDRHNGHNNACRMTFLREWKIPYDFIIGGHHGLDPDEIALPAPDDYGSLQLKQRVAYEYALGYNDLTHAFVSFTDTYINVPKLLKSGYEGRDYMGLQVKHGPQYISGGNGYWLSRAAMKFILKCDPIPDMQGDEADGLMLTAGGFTPTYDDRFGSTITRHLSKNTGNYDPCWMYEVHNAHR